MIRIANAQFWVHDQDEALSFSHQDTRLGGARRRHDGGVELPLADGRTRRAAGHRARSCRSQVRQNPPKAAGCWPTGRPGAGGTLFLETDDCQASYEELSARGVTFNDPPTAQAYGIDTSFRDPSGNNIRLTQVLEFDPARGASSMAKRPG